MNARRSSVFFVGAGMLAVVLFAGFATAQSDSGGKHSITGTLVDDGNVPVRNAVVALGPMPSFFEREQNTYAHTDLQGVFRIPVTYPGNATLSCYHPDFIGVTESVSTDDAVTITLRRGETLKGAVSGTDVPLGTALVSVYFPGSGYQDFVRADGRGRFEIKNLPVGRCEIEARIEKGNRRSVGVTTAVILPGKPAQATVKLPETGAACSGTVRDAAGNPVMATAALHVATDSGSYFESVRCDLDGHYSFAAVPGGSGQLVISATGKASQQLPVSLDEGDQTLESVILDGGQSLRCSFLNIPDGAKSIQVSVLFGKIARPGVSPSEVRALLDTPTAWTTTIREKSATLGDLPPGTYTMLAYPLASVTADQSTFETADLLRRSPVYMDSFTVNEGGAGTVIAAAFPGDGRAAHAAAHQPVHPILGTWAYEYKGSIWSRTFTTDGRCVLMEGPVTGWVNRYVILGERRVGVMIEGQQRIHEIRPDGKLDIEGQFVGTKVR